MILVACLPLLAAPLRTEAEVFQGVLARIDNNGDGTISPAEYLVVDPVGAFADLDTDGSGGIDVGELGAWVKRTQPRELGSAPPPAPKARTAAPAPAPTGLNPWLAGAAVLGGLGVGLGAGVLARRRRR